MTQSLAALMQPWRNEAKAKLNSEEIFLLDHPTVQDQGFRAVLMPYSVKQRATLQSLAQDECAQKVMAAVTKIEKKLLLLKAHAADFEAHKERAQLKLLSTLAAQGTQFDLEQDADLYQTMRLLEINSLIATQGSMDVTTTFLQSIAAYLELYPLCFFLHQMGVKGSDFSPEQMSDPVFAGLDDERKERIALFATVIADYAGFTQSSLELVDFVDALLPTSADMKELAAPLVGCALLGLNKSLHALKSLKSLQPEATLAELISQLTDFCDPTDQDGPALVRFNALVQSSAFARLKAKAQQLKPQLDEFDLMDVGPQNKGPVYQAKKELILTVAAAELTALDEAVRTTAASPAAPTSGTPSSELSFAASGSLSARWDNPFTPSANSGASAPAPAAQRAASITSEAASGLALFSGANTSHTLDSRALSKTAGAQVTTAPAQSSAHAALNSDSTTLKPDSATLQPESATLKPESTAISSIQKLSITSATAMSADHATNSAPATSNDAPATSSALKDSLELSSAHQNSAAGAAAPLSSAAASGLSLSGVDQVWNAPTSAANASTARAAPALGLESSVACTTAQSLEGAASPTGVSSATDSEGAAAPTHLSAQAATPAAPASAPSEQNTARKDRVGYARHLVSGAAAATDLITVSNPADATKDASAATSQGLALTTASAASATAHTLLDSGWAGGLALTPARPDALSTTSTTAQSVPASGAVASAAAQHPKFSTLDAKSAQEPSAQAASKMTFSAALETASAVPAPKPAGTTQSPEPAVAAPAVTRDTPDQVSGLDSSLESNSTAQDLTSAAGVMAVSGTENSSRLMAASASSGLSLVSARPASLELTTAPATQTVTPATADTVPASLQADLNAGLALTPARAISEIALQDLPSAKTAAENNALPAAPSAQTVSTSDSTAALDAARTESTASARATPAKEACTAEAQASMEASVPTAAADTVPAQGSTAHAQEPAVPENGASSTVSTSASTAPAAELPAAANTAACALSARAGSVLELSPASDMEGQNLPSDQNATGARAQTNLAASSARHADLSLTPADAAADLKLNTARGQDTASSSTPASPATQNGARADLSLTPANSAAGLKLTAATDAPVASDLAPWAHGAGAASVLALTAADARAKDTVTTEAADQTQAPAHASSDSAANSDQNDHAAAHPESATPAAYASGTPTNLELSPASPAPKAQAVATSTSTTTGLTLTSAATGSVTPASSAQQHRGLALTSATSAASAGAQANAAPTSASVTASGNAPTVAPVRATSTTEATATGLTLTSAAADSVTPSSSATQHGNLALTSAASAGPQANAAPTSASATASGNAPTVAPVRAASPSRAATSPIKSGELSLETASNFAVNSSFAPEREQSQAWDLLKSSGSAEDDTSSAELIGIVTAPSSTSGSGTNADALGRTPATSAQPSAEPTAPVSDVSERASGAPVTQGSQAEDISTPASSDLAATPPARANSSLAPSSNKSAPDLTERAAQLEPGRAAPDDVRVKLTGRRPPSAQTQGRVWRQSDISERRYQETNPEHWASTSVRERYGASSAHAHFNERVKIFSRKSDNTTIERTMGAIEQDQKQRLEAELNSPEFQALRAAHHAAAKDAKEQRAAARKARGRSTNAPKAPDAAATAPDPDSTPVAPASTKQSKAKAKTKNNAKKKVRPVKYEAPTLEVMSATSAHSEQAAATGAGATEVRPQPASETTEAASPVNSELSLGTPSSAGLALSNAAASSTSAWSDFIAPSAAGLTIIGSDNPTTMSSSPATSAAHASVSAVDLWHSTVNAVQSAQHARKSSSSQRTAQATPARAKRQPTTPEPSAANAVAAQVSVPEAAPHHAKSKRTTKLDQAPKAATSTTSVAPTQTSTGTGTGDTAGTRAVTNAVASTSAQGSTDALSDVPWAAGTAAQDRAPTADAQAKTSAQASDICAQEAAAQTNAASATDTRPSADTSAHAQDLAQYSAGAELSANSEPSAPRAADSESGIVITTGSAESIAQLSPELQEAFAAASAAWDLSADSTESSKRRNKNTRLAQEVTVASDADEAPWLTTDDARPAQNQAESDFSAESHDEDDQAPWLTTDAARPAQDQAESDFSAESHDEDDQAPWLTSGAHPAGKAQASVASRSEVEEDKSAAQPKRGRKPKAQAASRAQAATTDTSTASSADNSAADSGELKDKRRHSPTKAQRAGSEQEDLSDIAHKLTTGASSNLNSQERAQINAAATAALFGGGGADQAETSSTATSEQEMAERVKLGRERRSKAAQGRMVLQELRLLLRTHKRSDQDIPSDEEFEQLSAAEQAKVVVQAKILHNSLRKELGYRAHTQAQLLAELNGMDPEHSDNTEEPETSEGQYTAGQDPAAGVGTELTLAQNNQSRAQVAAAYDALAQTNYQPLQLDHDKLAQVAPDFYEQVREEGVTAAELSPELRQILDKQQDQHALSKLRRFAREVNTELTKQQARANKQQGSRPETEDASTASTSEPELTAAELAQARAQEMRRYHKTGYTERVHIRTHNLKATEVKSSALSLEAQRQALQGISTPPRTTRSEPPAPGAAPDLPRLGTEVLSGTETWHGADGLSTAASSDRAYDLAGDEYDQVHLGAGADSADISATSESSAVQQETGTHADSGARAESSTQAQSSTPPTLSLTQALLSRPELIELEHHLLYGSYFRLSQEQYLELLATPSAQLQALVERGQLAPDAAYDLVRQDRHQSRLITELRPFRELNVMRRVLLELADQQSDEQRLLRLQRGKFNYYLRLLGRNFFLTANARRIKGDLDPDLERLTNLSAQRNDDEVKFVLATILLTGAGLYLKSEASPLADTYRSLNFAPPC